MLATFRILDADLAKFRKGTYDLANFGLMDTRAPKDLDLFCAPYRVSAPHEGGYQIAASRWPFVWGSFCCSIPEDGVLNAEAPHRGIAFRVGGVSERSLCRRSLGREAAELRHILRGGHVS